MPWGNGVALRKKWDNKGVKVKKKKPQGVAKKTKSAPTDCGGGKREVPKLKDGEMRTGRKKKTKVHKGAVTIQKHGVFGEGARTLWSSARGVKSK